MGKQKREKDNRRRRNSGPHLLTPLTLILTETPTSDERKEVYYDYDRCICLKAMVTTTNGDEVIKWYVLNLSSSSSSTSRPKEKKKKKKK